MEGTFTQVRKSLLARIFASALALILSGCDASGVASDGAFHTLNPNPSDDGGVDSSRAIGFYTNGYILGAVALPPESAAHLKIFRLRDRGYGTRPLIDAIVRASAAFRQKFPYGDRVSVGDMSSEEGGTLARHSSHQNGLDADIAYLRKNHVERDPNVWGNEGFGESFVRNGRITANFDRERNWFLLKELVARGNVQRIFVDTAIKRFFCENARTLDPSAHPAVRTEVLRRLRPFPNHADHLHMRVTCSDEHARCVSQDEVSEGSGCSEAELNRLAFDESEH